MQNEFHQKDITRLLGIKRTALQQWMDRGYVAPSLGQADGHGSEECLEPRGSDAFGGFQGASRIRLQPRGSSAPGELKYHLQLWGGAPKVREDDGFDLEWSDVIGVEVFAVQLVDDRGSDPQSVWSSAEGRIFDQLPKIGEHLGLSTFKSFKVVNVTAALRTGER
jgi:hypothetical protein